MSKPTVADYCVQRLADLGIKHCFGLPGDFAFPIDDAVDNNPNIEWVVNANELNASYAADGYARTFGASLITTTFGVGELSAINGIMGSKAELLPVFHLVGAPSMRNVRAQRAFHHTHGDGKFDHFHPLSAGATCAHTLLTPANAVSEMERVIKLALHHRQPVYIQMRMDEAQMPIMEEPIKGVPLADAPAILSNENEVKKAAAAVKERLTAAKTCVVLTSFKLKRYGLEEKAKKLIEALGAPFSYTTLDKGTLPETHVQCIGQYNGNGSGTGIQEIIESADIVLDLGGILFDDFSSGLFTAHIQQDRLVSLCTDHVKMIEHGTAGLVHHTERTYSPAYFGDVMDALLAESLPKFSMPALAKPAVEADTSDPAGGCTYDSVKAKLAAFLASDDIFINETGTCSFRYGSIPLPEGCAYHNQTLWGSIGWATPAAFGAALAAPDKRVILVTGDGSHQLTANEIGVMGRYGVKPIILCLNNGVFGIEEYLEHNEYRKYNDIAPWEYSKLPAAMGCKDWKSTKVTTNAELATALAEARAYDGACYLEVVLAEKLVEPMGSASLRQEYLLNPV